MITKLKIISSLSLLFFLFNGSTIYSQNLYGGIEIGSKGIKITVLDIINPNKGKYELKKFWTINTGISKGISIDGKLNKEDIEKTINVVNENYLKLKTEFQIKENKIFIIASSGVAMAKNTDELVAQVKQSIGKDLEFITPKEEAKLLVKGGIPPVRHLNSLILDIGGGNTKGGFVGLFNEENLVFLPLDYNLGTVTLTEKIKKKCSSDDLTEFVKNMSVYKDSLNFKIKNMYDLRPIAKQKKNIYLSGGAIWAFMTLTTADSNENFIPIDYQSITNYHLDLFSNFTKFEKMANTNPEVERVLKTYSQKYLISANTLLLETINNLDNPKDKNYYFVKQGQIAWLLAYVLETAKNGKFIY